MRTGPDRQATCNAPGSIPDRREAIRQAVGMAKPGSVVLLAGKGHETYQEIAGVKHDFDDVAVLKETLELLHK
jgi:UDP-N-acetylmuramoyl-L-alanyl-D-glutamate--2,6-diaminopimelate ligase